MDERPITKKYMKTHQLIAEKIEPLQLQLHILELLRDDLQSLQLEKASYEGKIGKYVTLPYFISIMIYDSE